MNLRDLNLTLYKDYIKYVFMSFVSEKAEINSVVHMLFNWLSVEYCLDKIDFDMFTKLRSYLKEYSIELRKKFDDKERI